MKTAEFQSIYSKIIIPLAESLKTEHNPRFDPTKQNKIHECYEKIKDDVKQYFKDPIHSLIDRHKIGAALIYAILDICPFPLLNLSEEKLPPKEYMINERLAMETGVAVVADFCKTKAIQDRDATQKKIFSIRFRYPKVDESNYLEFILKSLYRDRVEGKKDILKLAHILFLLESYHSEHVKKELLRTPI